MSADKLPEFNTTYARNVFNLGRGSDMTRVGMSLCDEIERQARRIEILTKQVNGLTKCECGRPLIPPSCGVCDNDE